MPQKPSEQRHNKGGAGGWPSRAVIDMRYARWSAALMVPALLAGIYALHARRPAHPAAASAETTSARGGIAPVFGRVHDEKGPVAGARVRFKGCPQAVLTDAEGRFNLPPRTQASA